MALNTHWDAVQKLIEGFLELYPEAEYEFAHVVLSDYNLEDHWIEDTLKAFNQLMIAGSYDLKDMPRLEATEFFLKFLVCIPEDWRMPGQED